MIISIYGRNRAGKTTLADMLVNEYDFVKMGFADPLRKIVKNYFGIDGSWKVNTSWKMYDDKKYLNGIITLFSMVNDSDNIKHLILDRVSKATTKYQAYRITMELIGTNVFRNLILKNIWIAVLVFKLFRHSGQGSNIVIDDMRFNDERDMLDSLNTIFIKIKSPFEEPNSGHESQKYIDGFKFDYMIDNDGSKKDLIKKFKDLNIV